MCNNFVVFFFKHKTAYEMRISDWSSDVCSSDLSALGTARQRPVRDARRRHGVPPRAVAAGHRADDWPDDQRCHAWQWRELGFGAKPRASGLIAIAREIMAFDTESKLSGIGRSTEESR